MRELAVTWTAISALLGAAALAAGPPDRPPAVGGIVATAESKTVTRYTVAATDPEGQGLVYVWTLKPALDHPWCNNGGKVTAYGRSYVWQHGDVEVCRNQAARLSVKVEDRYWSCTGSYTGHLTGTGQPATCVLRAASLPAIMLERLAAANRSLDRLAAAVERDPRDSRDHDRLLGYHWSDFRLALLALPPLRASQKPDPAGFGLGTTGDLLERLGIVAKNLERIAAAPTEGGGALFFDAINARAILRSEARSSAVPLVARAKLLVLAADVGALARQMGALPPGKGPNESTRRAARAARDRLYRIVRTSLPPIWTVRADAWLRDVETWHIGREQVENPRFYRLEPKAGAARMKAAIGRLQRRTETLWQLP